MLRFSGDSPYLQGSDVIILCRWIRLPIETLRGVEVGELGNSFSNVGERVLENNHEVHHFSIA